MKNGRGFAKRAVDFGTEKGRRKYWACQRKGRYPSERKAQTVATELQATRQRDGNTAPTLTPYKCHECKGWHLTKRRKPGAPDLKAFDVVPE